MVTNFEIFINSILSCCHAPAYVRRKCLSNNPLVCKSFLAFHGKNNPIWWYLLLKFTNIHQVIETSHGSSVKNKPEGKISDSVSKKSDSPMRFLFLVFSSTYSFWFQLRYARVFQIVLLLFLSLSYSFQDIRFETTPRCWEHHRVDQKYSSPNHRWARLFLELTKNNT